VRERLRETRLREREGLCFGQRESRDSGGSVGFLSEGEEDLRGR
jgi:hypothetical protein